MCHHKSLLIKIQCIHTLVFIFTKLILYSLNSFSAYKYATCQFLKLLSPIFGYDQTAAIFACDNDDDDVTVPGLLNVDPVTRTCQYERNLQRHHKYRNSECAGCVSPSNCPLYFSKKDEQVSFYRTESALSFNYWARAGARRTQTFRFSNPFVLEHLHH